MVNAEILQAFLWHISLYSHSQEDIDTEADLITQARYFIGIDLGPVSYTHLTLPTTSRV